MVIKILRNSKYFIYVAAFFNTFIGHIVKYFLIGFLFIKIQFLILDFNFTLTVIFFEYRQILNLTHPTFENSGLISLTFYNILVGWTIEKLLYLAWAGLKGFLDNYSDELSKLKKGSK